MHALDDLDIIISLIDRIKDTISRETAASFQASADAIDAVTYRLSMLGEHCKRLPDEIKIAHPDVPWRAMVGLRNIVVHGYDNVSPAIVWRTATEELDAVRQMASAERSRLIAERDRGLRHER